MGGVGGQANVIIHFVQDPHVELTELGSGCNGGKERPGGIAGSHVVRGETGLIPREVVREVSPDKGSGGDADAGGGGEFGHVEDVERSGGDDAAGGVFDSEIGSLNLINIKLLKKDSNCRKSLFLQLTLLALKVILHPLHGTREVSKTDDPSALCWTLSKLRPA